MKFSGLQVAAARKLLGLSQGELADACGVDPNTIKSIELGKSRPHQKSIEKIGAALILRGIEFSNGTGLGVRLDFKKASDFAAKVTQGAKERPSEKV